MISNYFSMDIQVLILPEISFHLSCGIFDPDSAVRGLRQPESVFGSVSSDSRLGSSGAGSAWLVLFTREVENLREFQTCVFRPNVSAQLALALRGVQRRPTCLPPVLAGCSTVNSISQLQLNKSWARIPVNRGRTAPRPSLTDLWSLRAAQSLLGRQSVAAWTPLAGSGLQPT
jgi:hypothetical protein